MVHSKCKVKDLTNIEIKRFGHYLYGHLQVRVLTKNSSRLEFELI